MTNTRSVNFARLLLALALDVGLLFVPGGYASSGAPAELMRIRWLECRNTLILGAMAIAAAVFVAPVIWRGAWWQRGLAVLLFGFACVGVWGAFVGYRYR